MSVNPVGALLVALIQTPAAQRPVDFGVVDSTVAALIRAGNLPGAALVIVHGDQIVHVRGFGAADGSGRPITPDTPFFIGSTAKSLTAFAVMQLVDAGRIDLDAPVIRYLPWFKLRDSVQSSKITVRHLMTHRSGIPESACSEFLADRTIDPAASEAQIRWLAGVQPSGPAGSKWSYCNLNFTIAGLVIEAASGLSLAEYFRSRVFGPLDMRHSHTEWADAALDGLAQGYQYFFGLRFRSEMPANRGGLAHGYYIMSATDVGHFLIAELNQGRYLDRQVLSPGAMAERHRGQVAVVEGRKNTIGWMEYTFKGTTALDHGGSLPTYQSRFMVFPKDGWAVGLLSNGNGGSSDLYFGAAAEQVAALVIGATPDPLSGRWVYPLLFSIFSVVPILQLFGLRRGLLRFRGWRRDPATRPSTRRDRIRKVIVPVVLALFGGSVMAFGLPALFGSPLRVMRAFQADAGWMVTISGVAGLLWAAVLAVAGWRSWART